ncbi:MAG TPA: FkbM family methyltransferase [Allosphingosinicella sp.]|jgi:FkbM family methyltransferase
MSLATIVRTKLKQRLLPVALDYAVRSTWPQRKFLRDFLRAHRIDCVLDVGANVGQYGDDLRAIGYTGLIISFEPDPDTFERLSAHVAGLPNRVAIGVALGSEAKVASFHRMAASVFNSFRTPSSHDTHQFDHENRIVETVEVEVQTLATLLPQLKARHQFSRPLLKMDTQGFDVEVFRGAAGVYQDIVAIQSELPVKHLYEGTPSWTDAIAEYQAQGFDLAGIYQVNPGWDLVELDCYLVRKGFHPGQEG